MIEKLTPEQIHDIEQSAAVMKEHLIPVFRTFYEGCIENKFTKEEALHLTNSFMLNLLDARKKKNS